MQYFLNIPQITLAEYLTLDTSHASILFFMRQFIGEPKIESHEEDGKTWFWFATQHIIDELPILRISSKRTIQRKITEILEAELLERKVDCNKTYYSFTEKFFELWRGEPLEVRQKCRTMSDKDVALGATEMSHNHNTNINIPNQSIYTKECFDRFWKAYPNAKEEHRQAALVYFVQKQLHIYAPQILKAVEHYKTIQAVKDNYIYNPAKFLREIYPSYVHGVPDETIENGKTPKKFRDEAAALLKKVAWLGEQWDEIGAEARMAIEQSNGAVVTQEGVDLFGEKEIEVIRQAGGVEQLVYSHLTSKTKEQLERLMQ